MVLQIESILNADAYFPGDVLDCKVSFIHKVTKEEINKEANGTKSSPREKQTPTKKPLTEYLESASIQVGGLYTVEPNYLKLSPRSKDTLPIELDPQKTIGN